MSHTPTVRQMRATVRWQLLAVIFLILGYLSAHAQTSYDMGVNASGVAYWSSEGMFGNLVNSFSNFNVTDVNAEGYPLSGSPMAIIDPHGYPASPSYEFTYQGIATWALGSNDWLNATPVWNAGRNCYVATAHITNPDSRLLIRPTNLNSGDPPRNMTMTLAGTSTDGVFFDSFKKRKAPFKIIRAMDLMRTNNWGYGYASTLTPTYQSGTLRNDLSANGNSLYINGSRFYQGLGVAAPSEVRYSLTGKNYKFFHAKVGIDDEVGNAGSVVFEIYTDGVKVWNSATITGAMGYTEVTVNVEGKNELKLIVTDAGDGATNDHADWGDARFGVNVAWTDRHKYTWFNQTNGVANEYQIQLANATQRDLWVCVPDLATNDYITQFARQLRDNLDPDLHVYVELSNECWNWSFSAAQRCSDMSKAPYATGMSREKVYAKRAKEMGDIFRTEFGGGASRVRVVLAGQHADSSFLSNGLSYINTTYGAPGNYFYAIAAAPYLFCDSSAPLSPTMTSDQLFASMNKYYTEKLVPWTIAHKNLATQYGIQLLAYEGGQHLMMSACDGANPNDVAIATLIANAQKDPRMARLIQKLISEWFALGGGTFCYFNEISLASSGTGSGQKFFWGLLDRGTSPGGVKWDAVMELTRKYGDCNLDGVVDATDFAILSANIDVSGTTWWWEQGDFNADNVVDLADFELMKTNLTGVSGATITNFENAFHKPIAEEREITTYSGVPAPLVVRGYDLQGHALTYAIVANPQHGALSGTAPNFTYTTTDPQYSGEDSFKFKVNDGTEDSNIATVWLKLTPLKLAYEGFDGAVGALEAKNSGYGWGAPWFVQSNNTTVPGYNIANTSPLTYTNLVSTTQRGTGGCAYLSSGRKLDVSTAFSAYNNGSGLIGKDGTTLWVSVLLRRDVAGKQNYIMLHDGSTDWSGGTNNLYIGAISGQTNWAIKYNSETAVASTVPITTGQTALLVVKITFGAGGTDTATLYVNPTTMGGEAPTSGGVTLTNKTIQFKAMRWYPDTAVGNGSIDEIRYGVTYAAVTPPVTSAPFITVSGNSTNITDGDTTPSTTDNTDMGTVTVSGTASVSKTFTIKNTGNAALSLTGAPAVTISGTNAADFAVTTQPTTVLWPGDSTTFVVKFDPSAAGTRNATININNTDSARNPFNFSIKGTGSAPPICTEPFDAATGALEAKTGGTGWGAGWFVQSNDTLVPGYNIVNTSALTYSNLASSARRGTGGSVYRTCGRLMDVTNAFSAYNTGGYVCKDGTTLWMSVLLRRDVAGKQNYVTLHNSPNVAWSGGTSNLHIAFSGGTNWGIKVNSETATNSTVAITTGQTTLLVVKIVFGAGATDSATLYVNPTSLGGSDPTGGVTISGKTIEFKNFRWYPDTAAGNGSIDEIRFGDSYASVTPTL